MWLLDIKPAEQGRDIRTYECARCGASKSVLSDVYRLPASRLRGDFKRVRA